MATDDVNMDPAAVEAAAGKLRQSSGLIEQHGSTLDAATWGAELAVGEGRGRIYIVEPTGPIEDDPNLTTRSSVGIPLSRSAHANRCGSRARSQIGRATRRKRSKP